MKYNSLFSLAIIASITAIGAVSIFSFAGNSPQLCNATNYNGAVTSISTGSNGRANVNGYAAANKNLDFTIVDLWINEKYIASQNAILTSPNGSCPNRMFSFTNIQLTPNTTHVIKVSNRITDSLILMPDKTSTFKLKTKSLTKPTSNKTVQAFQNIIFIADSQNSNKAKLTFEKSKANIDLNRDPNLAYLVQLHADKMSKNYGNKYLAGSSSQLARLKCEGIYTTNCTPIITKSTTGLYTFDLEILSNYLGVNLNSWKTF